MTILLTFAEGNHLNSANADRSAQIEFPIQQASLLVPSRYGRSLLQQRSGVHPFASLTVSSFKKMRATTRKLDWRGAF
jgi:hypothetical protein